MKDKKVSNEKKLIFNTKGKVIGASVTAGVILLIAVIFMFVESGSGKLIVKNNTDVNLEYVNGKFVDSEDSLSKTVNVKNIEANKSLTKALKPIDLFGYNANYEIHLKFENHDEMLVDAGIFNDNFKGNIKVDFEKTSDPNIITLKIKASNGLLTSKLINCNEKYTINLSEGKITQ